MPEITPPKNLEIYRQCEIRRTLEDVAPRSLIIIELPMKGRPSEECAKYCSDIVWVKNSIARKGNIIIDGDGREWVIHEIYGASPKEGTRWDFKLKS